MAAVVCGGKMQEVQLIQLIEEDVQMAAIGKVSLCPQEKRHGLGGLKGGCQGLTQTQQRFGPPERESRGRRCQQPWRPQMARVLGLRMARILRPRGTNLGAADPWQKAKPRDLGAGGSWGTAALLFGVWRHGN